MNLHNLNVQEPYFSYIQSGKKTVEGRLNKGKFKEIKPGDTIIFNDLETNPFKVLETNLYSSFSEMIKSETLEKTVPDKKTIQDAVDVYYKFYTKAQEKEFGVLAIKIGK